MNATSQCLVDDASSELHIKTCATGSRRIWASGTVHPTCCGLGTRNRNTKNPPRPIMTAGMMNESPQLYSTKAPAIMEPKMFPNEVWEFHSPVAEGFTSGPSKDKVYYYYYYFSLPKISPRFPFPNQLATTVTTPGHPVVWNSPAIP